MTEKGDKIEIYIILSVVITFDVFITLSVFSFLAKFSKFEFFFWTSNSGHSQIGF